MGSQYQGPATTEMELESDYPSPSSPFFQGNEIFKAKGLKWKLLVQKWKFLPEDDLHIFHIPFIASGAFGTRVQGFDVGQHVAEAKREQHWRRFDSSQVHQTNINDHNHIRAWSHWNGHS